MTVALCPGSYDPPTNGHLDIISRVAIAFPHVIVGVVENPTKASLFSVSERVDMLEKVFVDRPGVTVQSFNGLVVELARSVGASAIVKGVRGGADFDYEMQMANMNGHLSGITTLFVPTSPETSFISSSLVKEIARLGGSIDGLVPAEVATALQERVQHG